MKGFHGCYWRFDLGLGGGERIPIEEYILQKTLGGVGPGGWLLYREAPVGVDPFAPEAPLIFSFSPLVDTPFTTSAKFAVVAKSPLTGGISDALSSSHFAIAGKRLGVDAIELDVHLTVDDHVVVIHDKDTGRVADRDLVVRASPLGEVKALDVGAKFDTAFAGGLVEPEIRARAWQLLLGGAMPSTNTPAIALDSGRSFAAATSMAVG